MKLTNVQQEAVNKIIDFYQEIINGLNSNHTVSLKAPTGAGKTFIAANVISNIFARASKNIICVVGTLSNAELPIAFNNKLTQYLPYTIGSKYYNEAILAPSSTKNTEHIPDFKLRNKAVYVFGLSAFNKNSLFYAQDTLGTFLTNLKNENYELIYIRDEAHIGSKNTKAKQTEHAKKFDYLLRENANFVLEMTAKPKNIENLVLISTKDLESDDKTLLKNKLESLKFDERQITDKDLIENALKKFKEIKEEYKKLNIRPCLLIQVDNDANEIKNKIKHDLFNEALNMLEISLQHHHLNYVKYLDKFECHPKELDVHSLQEISMNDSEVDAVIFKIGPSIGWDIPRACMLLQLRNISSRILNIQTIGRIMRNPMPNLQRNKITDVYYVYSEVNINDLIQYDLQKRYIDDNFVAGRIKLKNKEKILNEEKTYINQLKEWINATKNPDNPFYKDLISMNAEDIYYDSQHLNSQNTIVTFIPNYLKLKIYNLQNWNEYCHKYLLEKIEMDLIELANFFIEKENISAAKEKIKFLFFRNDYKKEWLKFWYKMKEINENDYEYVYEKKLLGRYFDWNENNDEYSKGKMVNVTDLKNYAYKILSQENTNKVLVDSKGEEIFLKSLLDDKKYQKFWKENIELICKLPTGDSEIYYEYFDNNKEIKKSYPDFMIKTKNNNLFFIEIKNAKLDYDINKTQNLNKVYTIYNNKELNLISAKPIKNVVLIILKWNSKPGMDNSIGNFETWYYDIKQKRSIEGDLLKEKSLAQFLLNLENNLTS